MASLRRHRRGTAEADDYDEGSAPDDTDTATDEEKEEDHGGLHLGFHSMTAKGIQHLCSELLEIKKASEQDLRANVYLSYLSFVRTFHQAGDLDKHVHRLKRQVMAHRRLIQHLSSNCLDRDDEEDGDREGSGAKDEDPDMEVDMDDWELDALLSEQRMEQALELVLGQRTMVPQQGKARVAERLASVAGNPRTPRPELLRALSGLCKLGEAERANQLLFNWHRASVVQGIHGCYIKELARMVFSSIVQASRSFVALHGHPSPHTPQLLRWAREEMEDFSVAFSEYVRSSSQQAGGQSLAVALEAAECAISYSSLLRPLGVSISEEDVGGLMAPCIREALATYARHLKEVVRLLVASDDWVLGRFLLMPPLFAAADDDDEHRRYCLLTAGGRKFVTLVGEVVDDVACPLRRVLGTDDSAAVQLVADLFGEYVTHSAMSQQQQQQQDQQQHISVLVNCTTLVSLLPTIGGAWSASAQRQVGGLIKEAAGQVWSCFCHQFIRDTMAANSASASPPPSAQGQMMPSLAFQVVFLRVRRLKDAYGAILGGDDGTMKKLLQELMEEVISWLSSKPPDSWIGHGAQAQLDVHFLLEIARLGGFDITAGALDLLRKARQDEVEADEEPWAADAARHAVQVLLLLHNMNSNNGDAEEEEEEENGDAEEAANAAEEFESESDDMASGKSAVGDDDGMESRKSSDEFISIEDDDNGDRLTLGSEQAAPQNPAIDDDSRRQATPLAAAEKDDAPRGRSRKKVSASSRPRWQ